MKGPYVKLLLTHPIINDLDRVSTLFREWNDQYPNKRYTMFDYGYRFHFDNIEDSTEFILKWL